MLTFEGHLCMGSKHLKGKYTVIKRSFNAVVSSHSLLTTPFRNNQCFERYRLLIALRMFSFSLWCNIGNSKLPVLILLILTVLFYIQGMLCRWHIQGFRWFEAIQRAKLCQHQSNATLLSSAGTSAPSMAGHLKDRAVIKSIHAWKVRVKHQITR